MHRNLPLNPAPAEAINITATRQADGWLVLCMVRRPGEFVWDIERMRYPGLTREELISVVDVTLEQALALV